MYLHLGNDFSVNGDDIIGVFDMDNTTVSKRGRNFLAHAEKNGSVINASDDLPKSFIVSQKDGACRVYISSISTQTLLKRSRLSDDNWLEVNNQRKEK